MDKHSSLHNVTEFCQMECPENRLIKVSSNDVIKLGNNNEMMSINYQIFKQMPKPVDPLIKIDKFVQNNTVWQ